MRNAFHRRALVVTSSGLPLVVAGLIGAGVPPARAADAAAQEQPKAATPEKKALAEELKWLQAERFTISTASLRAESVEHAPAKVRVISQRQIQERGYRTLEDLLKDLPGVDVLNHSQAESKNRVSFRGITGNSKFLILQDGVRINSPTGENITPVSENFPLFMASQV